LNQNQFLVDPHIALARTNDSSISRAINTQLLTEQNGQSIENVNSFETNDNEDDYKMEENIDGTAASDVGWRSGGFRCSMCQWWRG